jgi:hypothetical protein
MTARSRKSAALESTPWRVVIDGERAGQLWGKYASLAGAAATVRMLHARGVIGVRVVGPNKLDRNRAI